MLNTKKKHCLNFYFGSLEYGAFLINVEKHTILKSKRFGFYSEKCSEDLHKYSTKGTHDLSWWRLAKGKGIC